jgi:hypothetical protein
MEKVLDAIVAMPTMSGCGPVGYTTVLVNKTDLIVLQRIRNLAVFLGLENR